MMDNAKLVLNETGSHFSSLLVLVHVPQAAVLLNQEIPAYTFITFLSDVGGIMGVFLGISLWSLYDTFIAPLTKKIDTLIWGHSQSTSTDDREGGVFQMSTQVSKH